MAKYMARESAMTPRITKALAAICLISGFCGDLMRAENSPPGTTVYGSPTASTPKELDTFAFLVGKWEGTGRTRLPDGKIAQYGGIFWIGRYVLDGTAIADEFHATAPDGKPYLGISLRHFDARRKSWIVDYLNVSGSFLRPQVSESSGSVQKHGNDVIVLSQAAANWSRETYRVESPRRFSYSIDLSHDGGKNWSVAEIEMQFGRLE
jgi:hypothetical protein